MMEIRPSARTESDFEAWARLCNRCNQLSPTSPAISRRRVETRIKDGYAGEFFAEFRGEAVGAAACSHDKWFKEPDRYLIIMMVPAGPQAEEAEVALLDHCLGVTVQQGAKCTHIAFDDQRFSMLNLVRSRGYAELMRFKVTALDVPSFDFQCTRFHLDPSIRLATLAELESEGFEWKVPYYEAFRDILRDVPSGEEMSDLTWDDFCKIIEQPDRFRALSTFVALRNGQVLGLSELSQSEVDPTIAQTGLTGVRREERRQGIAIALKATAIQWAKAAGVQLIATDNASVNPMYHLNIRLGFTDRFSVYQFAVDHPAASP